MQCTDEQLGDGTIATALQAGREEVVWMQDTENGTPMLKIFMQPSYQPGDVNHDGSITIADVTELIDYLLADASAAPAEADVNQDSIISIGDVTDLIDILLGMN